MPPKLSSGPARLRAGHLWLMLAAVSLLSVPCARAQANPTSYALSFDGTNDYVGVSIGTALASNYTISAWVYLRQGGTYEGSRGRLGVISGDPCGSTTELLIHNDGNNASGPQYLELSRCNFYDSGSNSTAVIALSNWTHVAVTVSSSKQVSYFINGLPAGGWNATGQDVSLGPNLRLGDNSIRRFDGLLDEVQVWNVARSAVEIQSTMAIPLVGSEPGLVAYWPLDEGTGNTTADVTGHEHDGVLASNTTWVVTNAPIANGPRVQAVAYTFTTLAGKAISGSADGVGDQAQFSQPNAVALDTAGNLFVADAGNDTIRKITPAGIVTTLAGFPNAPGSADGTASNARFRNPSGVSVDSTGNIYVADTGNHTVRKITPSGIVLTIAGLAGMPGAIDGMGTNARFNGPIGLAVDAVGNIFVADTTSHTVRKISADGTVSTFAGAANNPGTNDGIGTSARFFSPQFLTLDGATNLYVSDNESNALRMVNPLGVVSTLGVKIPSPRGIVANGGTIFVASGNTILRIASTGTNWFAEIFAGGSLGNSNGTGTNALFSSPRGIAVDVTGRIYVADRNNNLIRRITASGVTMTLAGATVSSGAVDGTGSAARFFRPNAVALDSAGVIRVADSYNFTIREVTSAGVVSTLAGLARVVGSADGIGDQARFGMGFGNSSPNGMAIDSAGNSYVADTPNFTVRKISPDGIVSTFAGRAGWPYPADGSGTNASFEVPRSVAVDRSNNVFVSEFNTIRKISPSGVVTTFAGRHGVQGSANGYRTNALFYSPRGIAVDDAGTVYVADLNCVRRISPDGWVCTLAGKLGNVGSAGSIDGAGRVARFRFPEGVAVDAAGNVLVADTGNSTIRRISPDGFVSTLAGVASSPDYGDGIGSEARFFKPEGVAVDAEGNILVADTINGVLRRGAVKRLFPFNPVTYSAPPANGSLRVDLVPDAANGQWRFPWEFGWHHSGDTVSNLVAGNYPVEFRTLSGWLAIPLSAPVPVPNGEAVSITNEYYPTIIGGDGNSTPGSLTVLLGSPPRPVGAGWRFLGDTTPFLPHGFATNLPPGTYLIEFAFVSGRVKPPSQAVLVSAGAPAFLSVSYQVAPAPPANVFLPFPVPANQLSDETTFPFGFNGQLQSDTGYGSGVAVSTNVVLTAAHLVFNDQTLSYVSRAHWFFRRDAGVSEPLPQAARGFYVLSGYAAQRTNDLASGYTPEQSTPPSRNTDVAALYFLLPVAGGGHGGYLPSDAVPNTWLTSTALKMLVGYPVDGSQFGASLVPGKMYQTDPQPYPLSLAPDAVPGQQQQVYEAPWFLSYPGNSGGPLYVQLNGYYYPAAVYLGTRFSGAQPVSSLVRAIDSNVVNLITLAASQGDSGTNFTGGGVITIIPSANINANNPGYVQFQLAPPAALRAGAVWRLRGGVTTNYCGGNLFCNMLFVTSTNPVVVEFLPLPGWNLPPDQSISVARGQIGNYTAFYSVTNPVLFQTRVGGTNRIGMTGTTGTVYRLERKSALTNATWLTVTTNTIRTNGFNPVLTDPEEGFYRLNWVTNF